MNLDDELRRALGRTPAPADLADRVLARIVAGEAARPSAAGAGAHPLRRWLAAAAVLALAAGGAERYYTQQRQAAEAARVREDLRVALQITSEALERVQSKISQPAAAPGR